MRRLNGKPVVDATKPLTVRVEDTDIKKATKKSPAFCALAYGINKEDRIYSVRVGATIVLVEYARVVKRFQLRPIDALMVKVFDRTGQMLPETYKLMPPKIKIGGQAGRYAQYVARYGKPTRKSVYKARPLRHLHQ